MNIPILSFLKRYWLLLVMLALALVLCLTDLPFKLAGMFVFLPARGLGAIIVALLIRHLFFRQTLELDVDNGDFVTWWKALAPRDRVFANLAIMAVLFLGLCHIAASL